MVPLLGPRYPKMPKEVAYPELAVMCRLLKAVLHGLRLAMKYFSTPQKLLGKLVRYRALYFVSDSLGKPRKKKREWLVVGKV